MIILSIILSIIPNKIEALISCLYSKILYCSSSSEFHAHLTSNSTANMCTPQQIPIKESAWHNSSNSPVLPLIKHLFPIKCISPVLSGTFTSIFSCKPKTINHCPCPWISTDRCSGSNLTLVGNVMFGLMSFQTRNAKKAVSRTRLNTN